MKRIGTMAGVALMISVLLIVAPAHAQDAGGQSCEQGASAVRAQYGDCDSEGVVVVPPDVGPGNPVSDINTSQQNTSTVEQSAASYGNTVIAEEFSVPDEAQVYAPASAAPAAVASTGPSETASYAVPTALPETGGPPLSTPLAGVLLSVCLGLYAGGQVLRRWAAS